MHPQSFAVKIANFFLLIKHRPNSIPLLERIKLIALYAITVVVIVGVAFNLPLVLAKQDFLSSSLLIVVLFLMVFGVILFLKTRYMLAAQLPSAIAIIILAFDSIRTAGGVYGFGVLYFIAAIPLIYLFYGLGIGILFALFFYFGSVIRFLIGHFTLYSIYNMHDFTGRIMMIMGISTVLGIVVSVCMELFVRYLTRLAYFDRITQLPNRYKIEEYLRRSVFQGIKGKRTFSVLGIKIMNYTKINAMLGTDLGDQMLEKIGERICASLNESRMTARWSGSLFLAVLETTDYAVLDRYNTTIMEALSSSFLIGNRYVAVVSSVGVCRYPDDAASAAKLISNVISLIDRNENNPGELLFFNEENLQREQYRFTLIEAMNRADFNRDFALVYQPKIRLSDESCVGAEILLRWTDPDLGSISPAVFIPLSEETGYIRKITRWVIRHCFADLGSASGEKKTAVGGGIYAINLSVVDLKDRDLIPFIRQEMTGRDWLLGCIEFEITEGMLIDEDPQIRKNIAQLITLGFRIAIDDFGTGYSCLSYLHTLRVQNLKIDQSFIRGISGLASAASVPVIDAIISMGKALDLEITAEGVENEEQAAYLRSRNCDSVQGWNYSKGLPFAEYLEYRAAHVST